MKMRYGMEAEPRQGGTQRAHAHHLTARQAAIVAGGTEGDVITLCARKQVYATRCRGRWLIPAERLSRCCGVSAYPERKPCLEGGPS